MSPSDVVTLAIPALIFACGMALLSYRFYAVYRGWSSKGFSYTAHFPGILGIALMVFAVVFASSLGWPHVIVALLGGAAIGYLYVDVFRMRVEAALLGPVFAMAAIFLIPMRLWV